MPEANVGDASHHWVMVALAQLSGKQSEGQRFDVISNQAMTPDRYYPIARARWTAN